MLQILASNCIPPHRNQPRLPTTTPFLLLLLLFDSSCVVVVITCDIYKQKKRYCTIIDF